MMLVPLSDGTEIPQLGLGVYQADNADTYTACKAALEHGYRHIDTAAYYGNEAAVGRAVRESGVLRGEVYVTTKLKNPDHGYDKAIAACEASLKELGLEYIDLYLIHAPVPGLRLESYRALEECKRRGLIRSIGVSNYNEKHLAEIFSQFDSKPVLNQIELSPYLTRPEVVAFCEKNGIVVEAYSPLTKGEKLGDPRLVAVAKRYGKTPAQLLIRWGIQKGFVSIPKSVRRERIIENADVFEWSISAADMAELDGFDEGLVTGWDPLAWD